MINSYLKTAFRSITRKKTFTILNIAGLSAGIAAALIIFLVISYERSFDTWHTHTNTIYRVTTDVMNRSNGEVIEQLSTVNWELPEKIKADFSGVEKVGLISFQGGAQMYVPAPGATDEKRFKQNDIFYTSPDFYSIFDYSWLAGNAEGLSAPNTAVISEKVAKAYFGDIHAAIGRTIQMWSFRVPLQVTGVFKDLPANTDLPVQVGVSYSTLKKLVPEDFTAGTQWDAVPGGYGQCFVLLKKPDNAAAITAGLPAFAKRYYKPHNTRLPQLKLQPLTAMHLDKRYPNFTNATLSTRELWALTLIGIFLLIVACINFINLATALSVNRAKEIGVRKVLGSNRLQLFSQFLSETGVITLLSIAVAIVITIVALPYAGNLIDRQLPLSLLATPRVWAAILACGIVVTLLSGFYPGMIVSGFNPVTALKSKISIKSTGGVSLRRGLVVFQFVVAQLLVIGTLVVLKQMDYVRHQSMGFNKDAVVMINLPSDSTLKLKYNYLKASLAALPGVTNVSFCADAPTTYWIFMQNFYFDTNPEGQPFKIGAKAADADFYKTFDIKLKAGRLPYPSDTLHEITVNETTVKKLGLSSPENILGKTITIDHKSYPVVGVVNDFNSKSLHEAIVPMFIGSQAAAYEYVAVRMDPGKVSTTLKSVQQTFTGIYPTYLYDLFFLDERIRDFYAADVITSKLFQLFAGIAIFISCLGLYGLVSFMVTNRTREVGIRKVLGASVNNILFLFSKEFMLLIGIAFVIAAPLGYFFMQGWLSGFYYHTAIGVGVFAAAIILSLMMAWITVGYKALKAALSNPVKNLREN
ncbi:ABC transporter permease [Chitinophaga sp. RCC_12]|uniref:ABC transporter permease n=1 Tax=Chitinophaga sp. RCC_12 TaxID=3239226 RepID=UPI0035246E74